MKEYKLEILSKKLNENYKRDIIETITTTNISKIRTEANKALNNDNPINFYINNVCKNSTISRYL